MPPANVWQQARAVDQNYAALLPFLFPEGLADTGKSALGNLRILADNENISIGGVAVKILGPSWGGHIETPGMQQLGTHLACN